MKKLFSVLGMILAASLSATSAARADMVKTVHTQYYMVQGTTPKEIYKNLEQDSPLNKGMSTFQAHTRTKISTRYNIEQQGGQCRVRDVVVYLDLTYLYPRLVHSVDYETRKWWNKFMRRLTEHEEIHGDISIKAAHKLDDLLRNMRPGDCRTFKQILKARISEVMNGLQRDQKAYDALTQHGLKQERNRGRYP